MWEKWKHAFAVGAETATPPTPEQLEQIDRLCRVIRQRQLTPAALAFLEMSRPLNFLGAQAMHFLEPIATTVFSQKEYQELAKFLERRDAIDLISARLESLESGKATEDTLACDEGSAAPTRDEPSA